jgi:hypothetical protein
MLGMKKKYINFTKVYLLMKQECHRSLDTGEGCLTRQPSISSKIFDSRDSDYIEHPTNLIKGKSMPSLRYGIKINFLTLLIICYIYYDTCISVNKGLKSIVHL